MRRFRSVLRVALASLMVLVAAAPMALARDNGQWENSPPNVRRWFQGLRQPDNPRASCCGEADAYEADIFEVDGGHYVVITDGKGEIPNWTKIPVPNNKIKWDEGIPPVTASSSSASKDRFIATSSLAECDRLRGRQRRGDMPPVSAGGPFILRESARSVQVAEDGTSSLNISWIISFSIAAAKVCPKSSAMLKSRRHCNKRKLADSARRERDIN